jgi:hypothetical protein
MTTHATTESKLIAELRAKVLRLEAWVSDLQSGMYVNCVYCGHRYGPGETTPVSIADVLKAHIEVCPEHPMSKMRAALEKLWDWNEGIRDGRGNHHPEDHLAIIREGLGKV